MTLTLMPFTSPTDPVGSDLNGNSACVQGGVHEKTPVEAKTLEVVEGILDLHTDETNPPTSLSLEIRAVSAYRSPKGVETLESEGHAGAAARAAKMPPNTRPLSEESPTQSNIIQELQKFMSTLMSFEERTEKHFKEFDASEAVAKKSLAGAEYIHSNEESSRSALDWLLPSEGSSVTDALIHHVAQKYKWANVFLPLTLHLSKKFKTSLFQSEFKELDEEFRRLKSQKEEIASSSLAGKAQINEELATIQSKLDQINQRLKKQIKESDHKIKRKAVKFGEKFSSFSVDKLSPLEDNGVLHRVSKSSFSIVKNGIDSWTYQKALGVLQEWNFHLQPRMQVQIDSDEIEPDFSYPIPDGIDDDEELKIIQNMAQNINFLSNLYDCSSLVDVNNMVEKVKKNKENDPSEAYQNIYQLLESLEIETCATEEEVKQKIRRRLSQEKANFHNTSLARETLDFLNSLKKCSSPEAVEKILSQYSLTSIEVPESIDQWHAQMENIRFSKHLVELYYSSVGKRLWMTDVLLEENLKSREKQTNAITVRAALTIIPAHCKECESKDFAQIKAHFKKSHINIEAIALDEEVQKRLPSPPSTKDEWETCIKDPAFRLALARQYVEHQETTAQLVHQAAQQGLRSKIEVESTFLGDFRVTACNASIAFDLLRFAFCLTQLQAAISVLDLFVTNFSKLNVPGMGIAHLLYPLYPNLKFKLEAIVILLAEHFFAIKYKPYEYSLQGYKLIIQIRLLSLKAMVHSCLSNCQKLLLWLNIRLVENCIMGMKQTPFENDTRYAELDNNLNTARNTYEKEIRLFMDQLTALKTKDANLTIAPRGKKGQEVDFFESITEALADSDVDYFPYEVLHSWQENFGFELTNELINDKNALQKKLENFFINSEDQLSEHHLENRFSYLRSAAG